MSAIPQNKTHENILAIASTLFAERGFAAVTLRDVADALRMKQGSLYYYIPGGKDELFVQVMEYSFQRHQTRVQEIVDQSSERTRETLYAVVDWFVDEPPIDLGRMFAGDRPNIDAQKIDALSALAYNAVRMPIISVLQRPDAQGALAIRDYDLAAMALVSIIDSIRNIPIAMSHDARKALAHQLVDMLMDGWRTR